MSHAPYPDRVAAGRARLEARARRLATIRRRIAATALAAFALAWGVIAWHGPMGHQTQAAAATGTPTADDDAADARTVTTTDLPAAVTTAQS